MIDLCDGDDVSTVRIPESAVAPDKRDEFCHVLGRLADDQPASP